LQKNKEYTGIEEVGGGEGFAKRARSAEPTLFFEESRNEGEGLTRRSENKSERSEEGGGGVRTHGREREDGAYFKSHTTVHQ